MTNKTLSGKSTAMQEIESYIGYNAKQDKEIIEENEKILDSIIERKFKERGWERIS